MPWPTWSRVIDVIGPIARGVRTTRGTPSRNSATHAPELVPQQVR